MLMLTQLFYISFGGEVSKRNFPKITKPGPCAIVNLKRGTIVFFSNVRKFILGYQLSICEGLFEIHKFTTYSL